MEFKKKQNTQHGAERFAVAPRREGPERTGSPQRSPRGKQRHTSAERNLRSSVPLAETHSRTPPQIHSPLISCWLKNFACKSTLELFELWCHGGFYGAFQQLADRLITWRIGHLTFWSTTSIHLARGGCSRQFLFLFSSSTFRLSWI